MDVTKKYIIQKYKSEDFKNQVNKLGGYGFDDIGEIICIGG